MLVRTHQIAVRIKPHALFPQHRLHRRRECGKRVDDRDGVAIADKVHVARAPVPGVAAHNHLVGRGPEPQLEQRHQAHGVDVEEEANHVGLLQRAELPLYLVAERGVLGFGRDAGVPVAAARVGDGDGQWREKGCHVALPLHGFAHFNAAGGEDRELAVRRWLGGVAVDKVAVWPGER